MSSFAAVMSQQRGKPSVAANDHPAPLVPPAAGSSESRMSPEFMAEFERRLNEQRAGSENPVRS